MMKFEYQFDETSPKVTLEMTPQSSLSEVFVAFREFLLGAGYQITGEIAELEESEEYSEDDEVDLATE